MGELLLSGCDDPDFVGRGKAFRGQFEGTGCFGFSEGPPETVPAFIIQKSGRMRHCLAER